MRKLILISFMLVACSSAVPKRDFKVRLYKTDAVCVQYKTEEGEVLVICDDDERWPQDLIGISIEDYNKERDYQSLLINKCKRWK